MNLADLFRRRDPAAHSIYAEIVAQARRPDFYLVCGVADTVQGRYEMIALHMFLVLHRLKGEGKPGAALAQDLFDLMFADMDRNLRELGTGDLSVGKRIKTLAQGLYGRVAAYERGLSPGQQEALRDSLSRNVFAGAPAHGEGLSGLTDYLQRAATALAAQDFAEICSGRIAFAALPVAGMAAPRPGGEP
jgi:cytochrome b pre-mRNA-processing protein 3